MVGPLGVENEESVAVVGSVGLAAVEVDAHEVVAQARVEGRDRADAGAVVGAVNPDGVVAEAAPHRHPIREVPSGPVRAEGDDAGSEAEEVDFARDQRGTAQAVLRLGACGGGNEPVGDEHIPIPHRRRLVADHQEVPPGAGVEVQRPHHVVHMAPQEVRRLLQSLCRLRRHIDPLVPGPQAQRGQRRGALHVEHVVPGAQAEVEAVDPVVVDPFRPRRDLGQSQLDRGPRRAARRPRQDVTRTERVPRQVLHEQDMTLGPSGKLRPAKGVDRQRQPGRHVRRRVPSLHRVGILGHRAVVQHQDPMIPRHRQPRRRHLQAARKRRPRQARQHQHILARRRHKARQQRRPVHLRRQRRRNLRRRLHGQRGGRIPVRIHHRHGVAERRRGPPQHDLHGPHLACHRTPTQVEGRAAGHPGRHHPRPGTQDGRDGQRGLEAGPGEVDDRQGRPFRDRPEPGARAQVDLRRQRRREGGHGLARPHRLAERHGVAAQGQPDGPHLAHDRGAAQLHRGRRGRRRIHQRAAAADTTERDRGLAPHPLQRARVDVVDPQRPVRPLERNLEDGAMLGHRHIVRVRPRRVARRLVEGRIHIHRRPVRIEQPAQRLEQLDRGRVVGDRLRPHLRQLALRIRQQEAQPERAARRKPQVDRLHAVQIIAQGPIPQGLDDHVRRGVRARNQAGLDARLAPADLVEINPTLVARERHRVEDVPHALRRLHHDALEPIKDPQTLRELGRGQPKGDRGKGLARRTRHTLSLRRHRKARTQPVHHHQRVPIRPGREIRRRPIRFDQGRKLRRHLPHRRRPRNHHFVEPVVQRQHPPLAVHRGPGEPHRGRAGRGVVDQPELRRGALHRQLQRPARAVGHDKRHALVSSHQPRLCARVHRRRQTSRNVRQRIAQPDHINVGPRHLPHGQHHRPDCVNPRGPAQRGHL